MKDGVFTLVELLIVVVIISVLAALIVPRFLSQAKRAQTAEALQVIGAIRRATFRYLDAGGSTLNLNESSSDDEWKNLSLKNPGISKLWAYRVDIAAGGTSNIYAIYRADGLGGGGAYGGSNPGTYMELSIGSDGKETWNCVGSTLRPLYSSLGNVTQIGCQF